MTSDGFILYNHSSQRMPELADGSVDCVFTSPPYWRMRDYGEAEQIGLEPTVELYIDALLEVFAEAKRVLKETGSAWAVIGDTYRRKRLMLVPERLTLGLSAQGWIVRNVVVWRKKDPLPESVRDRLSKAHERMLHLVKTERYFYDLDAIRQPHSGPAHQAGRRTKHAGEVQGERRNGRAGFTARRSRAQHPRGKNPGDVFECATSNCREAHFATLPVELAAPRILSTTRGGETVLDPFAGAGSTGVAALRLGRRFAGYEINAQYVEISRRGLEEASASKPMFAPASSGS